MPESRNLTVEDNNSVHSRCMKHALHINILSLPLAPSLSLCIYGNKSKDENKSTKKDKQTTIRVILIRRFNKNNKEQYYEYMHMHTLHIVCMYRYISML